MLSFFNSPSILHPFFSLSVNWNCQSASLWWRVSSRKFCRTCRWHSKNWCVSIWECIPHILALCVCMYTCMMCVTVSNLILLISGEAFKRVLPALKQQNQCPTAKSGGASVSYWWGQLEDTVLILRIHILFNTKYLFSCDPCCTIISAECEC